MNLPHEQMGVIDRNVFSKLFGVLFLVLFLIILILIITIDCELFDWSTSDLVLTLNHTSYIPLKKARRAPKMTMMEIFRKIKVFERNYNIKTIYV